MIIVRKLTKRYGDNVYALCDVTFAVPQGEFVFLVGPNGAGKTTLFKLMIREEEATSGCVLFNSTDVATLRPQALARHRRRLGAVFQDARLLSKKTVAENVAFPLEADGIDRAEIAEQVAASLFLSGLEDLSERFPDQLSGGQRQQVAIARALVNHPQVILADEPTGNLSPGATQKIMRLFSCINELGITVIIATHNREVVDAMNKRVLALDRGNLVSDSAQSAYPDFLRAPAA
jgi:cell division transport system ATP-binding protein